MILNYVLIAVLIIGLIVAAIYYVKWSNQEPEEEVYENPYTEQHLIRGISEVFALQLKQNLRDMNLTRKELDLQNKNKSQLRSSLKEAAYGNQVAKKYIKSYIRDIIRENEKLGINEETINNVIKFGDYAGLKTKDKFEIVLYLYNKQYNEFGLTKMIDDYQLNQPHLRDDGSVYYDISAEDIDRVYREMRKSYVLTYEDKLEILSQRIFEAYKGFGSVDMLFDSTIDEIDCGVSGVPKDSYDIKGMSGLKGAAFSYESVWIVYHGINIRMSCLSFGSQDELIRVCQNIYKFNAPESLSRRNGYVISTMKDGSRIVVVRPPFSDSWAFFARKFDSTPSIAPKDLFRDPGSEYVITVIKWLIRTQRNIIITGSQGTGKTTTLKSVLRFVPEYLTIRIEEKAFEMNLRYVYANRSIVTFQETGTISMQDGLDLQKKTNGCLNVFGEIASRIASGEYLQTCRVASLFGIGTHHAKTTKDLVRSFAVDGETEETVSQTINFDIHMENEAGHRFCQRITEIIPIRDRRYPSEIDSEGLDSDVKKDTIEYHKRVTDRQVFEVRDIVKYENGRYHLLNMPSEEMLEQMKLRLTDEEKKEFDAEFKKMRGIKIVA